MDVFRKEPDMLFDPVAPQCGKTISSLFIVELDEVDVASIQDEGPAADKTVYAGFTSKIWNRPVPVIGNKGIAWDTVSRRARDENKTSFFAACIFCPVASILSQAEG